MDFQTDGPVRGYKFHITLKLKSGDFEDASVAEKDDDKVKKLLQQLTKYIPAPAGAVSQITIDVGDRQDNHAPSVAPPEPTTGSTSGVNTTADLK